jgi:hypothetical protein
MSLLTADNLCAVQKIEAADVATERLLMGTWRRSAEDGTTNHHQVHSLGAIQYLLFRINTEPEAR